MFAQTLGSTTLGINGALIIVEVDIANGIPALDIVGLPDTAIKEAKERVKAAIKNAGFEFPMRRITVNLAPADMKKDGSGLDLPIAIGIMAASGQIEPDSCRNKVFIGELSLEGRLRGITGILPMALNIVEQNKTEVYLPPENAQEALFAGKLTAYAPETLTEVINHLNGEVTLKPIVKAEYGVASQGKLDDLSEVQGQSAAKRAMEIAAAGGHNILMIGPPGSGKTMLARRLPSILPMMSEQEAIEVTKIYSVAGLLKPGSGLVPIRPFRAPHHTLSYAGMIGGGRIPKPGEVTLSHNGVLFLDELPEFPRQVLEVLRQPVEDGQVTISRVNASLSYPAKFMLIAAMNPCPCGYNGDSSRQCTCAPGDIRRYIKRISGPLMDRIDIYINVPRLNYQEISENHPAESSATIAERVKKARNIQYARLQKYGLYCNSQMSHRHIRNACKMSEEAQEILKRAFQKMNLSARGYDRILKVARTIADLAGEDEVSVQAVAEAIQLRNDIKESVL